jgi:hypothetical protein
MGHTLRIVAFRVAPNQIWGSNPLDGSADPGIVVVQAQQGHSFTVDASLLARNLLQRITEQLGVIPRNRRDCTDVRLDQPRCIQATAQSRLDDCSVHSCLSEGEHGGEEGGFEVCRVDYWLDEADLPNFLEVSVELRGTDWTAIDSRSLLHGDEVRRGEQTDEMAIARAHR